MDHTTPTSGSLDEPRLRTARPSLAGPVRFSALRCREKLARARCLPGSWRGRRRASFRQAVTCPSLRARRVPLPARSAPPESHDRRGGSCRSPTLARRRIRAARKELPLDGIAAPCGSPSLAVARPRSGVLTTRTGLTRQRPMSYSIGRRAHIALLPRTIRRGQDAGEQSPAFLRLAPAEDVVVGLEGAIAERMERR